MLSNTAHFSSPSDLVPEPFAGNYGDIFAHALVSVEIVRESSVILLNDDAGRLLDGFRSHSTLEKIKPTRTC